MDLEDVKVLVENGTCTVENGTPEKDGLLSQEQEDLSERVVSLEKKVQQQADEVVCLKSALSDVIRRLSQLEAEKIQNNLLPSKPNFRPSSAKKSPLPETRKSHLNPVDNAYVTPQRNGHIRSSPSPMRSQPLKKWSSLSNSAELNNSNLSPVKRSGSQYNLYARVLHPKGGKAPTWNPDEKYLKIYLKGRAVPFYAPSEYKDVQVEKQAPAPSEKLQLEWVYGYRGRDCRCNLYYLPTGEIVYFTAAAVVLYNVEEQTQRHYTGHTDDVKCLAIHPGKIRIATGQVAGHDRREGKKFVKEQFKDSKYDEERFLWPHVRIWDSVSLNTLQVIGIGDFDRAVCCVSFSKVDGGQQLVAVDDANEHVISIWDISKDKAHKITETKSSTEPVLAAEFHPSEKTSVITCGKGQISFWTIDSGTLTKKLGIFDKHEKPKYVLSLAFSENGDTITGDSNGNIFIWGKGGNRITQAINGAHEGGVFSLCIMKDETLLSGGGKDRKIIQWDANYKRSGVETEIPEQFGPVRTISQGNGNLILVGTTRNCILKGSLELELQPIVQGHMEELWGLATHPTQQQFLTCSYDKHIYLWDALSHTVVWCKAIEDSAHCCCFHPNGNLAAIGSQSGKWKVIDLTSRDIVAANSDGSEQIECVQYSPDGKLLALGSRDNHVYVYEVSDDGLNYSKRGRCSGHSSFITHLDWSENSEYIVTNSGDYEILFWTSSDCKQLLNPSSVRDEVWATQNCTLGFSVAGIWPEGADGTDINACAASHKRHLVASADDYGKVNIYNYPCFQPKALGNAFQGHSSHVTNVAFVTDDTRLISTGGKDTSVLQWVVV